MNNLTVKLASSESLDSDPDDENSAFVAVHHETVVHQSSSSASFDQIDPRCIEGEVEDCAVEVVSIKDSLNDSGTDDDDEKQLNDRIV